MNFYQQDIKYDQFGDEEHQTKMEADRNTLNITLAGNYGNIWYNQDLSDDSTYGSTNWVYPLLDEKYNTIIISSSQDLNFTTSKVNYYRAAFVVGSADFIINQSESATFRIYFAGKGNGGASLYGGMLLEGGLNGDGGLTVNNGNAEFIINTDTNGSTTPVKYWQLISIDDGGYAKFKDIANLTFTSVGDTEREDNPARAIVMDGGSFEANAEFMAVDKSSDSAADFYDFVRMNGGHFVLSANTANINAENVFSLYNSGTFAEFTAKQGQINGNIETDQYARLDLKLGESEDTLRWTGKSTIKKTASSENASSDCGINLVMNPSATWNMTSSSEVSSLDFAGSNNSALSATIDFVSNRLPDQEFSTLRIGRLTSSSVEGNFIMSTDIIGETDVIEMERGEGEIKISFNEIKNSEADQNFANKYFAHQKEGILSITGSNGEGSVSARGAVQSWLISFLTAEQAEALNSGTLDPLKDPVNQSDGGEGYWYLVRPDSGSEVNPPEIVDNIAIGTSASQALAYMADLEDLRKRLGEVRYGAQAGAWVKAFAKKDSVGTSGGRGFEQDVYGINVGLDTLAGISESSSWLIGGAFRYSNADQDGIGIGGTSGKLDEYALKGYVTWMHEKGSYADFVLQAGRYEQELDGLDNTGSGRSHADYGTWGFGASIEVGHMFSFAEDVNDRRWFNHFFIEPQLELSYFHARGADYRTSTGLKVSQDNADFLTGRAGLVLGKKFSYGTEDELDRRFFQFAVIGGVKHEFLGGDQTIRYTGVDGARASVHADDIDGTRFYYGINADWQVADDFRLYAQIDREEGDHYTKDYDVSIGAKWSF